MEDLEVVRLLACACKPDALAGGDPKGERSAAAGVAVQLGQDHAIDPDLLAEHLADLDGLLAGHRVGHQQRFCDGDGGLESLQLRHEIDIDVKTPRRVKDDHVRVESLRFSQRRVCDRVNVSLARMERHILA